VESKEHREQFNPDSKTKPTKERASIAEQAKALLSGKDQWKTGTDKSIWEDIGEAEEVETDVVLPKI
jgi:large subunit ribosomal protein L23